MRFIAAAALAALTFWDPNPRTLGPSNSRTLGPSDPRTDQGDCVKIGTPNPKKTYVTSHVESTGKSSTVSAIWESVTEKGSRHKWTAPAGTFYQFTDHRIVNDATLIERMAKHDVNERLLEATTFRPGLVGDPAFRACIGKTWNIPAVTAFFQSGTLKVSSQTPVGTLKILSINARVTVPAGTFTAVHYTRTSQSFDEYWKSLEHGVVVKHIAKVAGNTVTEQLMSIK